MNGCGRAARLVDRSSGLGPLVSALLSPRAHGAAAAASSRGRGRGQATAAGEKPRLTAADLADKIRQEKDRERKKQQQQQQQRGPAGASGPGGPSGPSGPGGPSAPGSAQQRRLEELRRFSQQLQKVHPNVLAKHLHRGCLFQDEELVFINKPHGVPLREEPGVSSVSSVLPALSKMVEGPRVKSRAEPLLLLGLGLEKEMSGVLLLSRTEEAAHRILNLHRHKQVHRKYWVLAVGVPVPSEGVVDIPVVERAVAGARPHFKMSLSPLFRVSESGDSLSRVRARRQSLPAVTRYRVLDSGAGCSLVELQPFTAVKHQLRVHMALALGCPILGDHKYSHLDKLAPQKLPERVLGKLGLEQSKVRHLPLHLHARQLVLPRQDGTDLDVSCPLPKYFSQTMRRFLLNFPDREEKK